MPRSHSHTRAVLRRLAEYKAQNRKSKTPDLGLDQKIEKATKAVERLSKRPRSKTL